MSLALQDNKVVDHACVALSRIADSFARSPAQLQVLCAHGLIRNAMQLVRHWTISAWSCLCTFAPANAPQEAVCKT